MRCRSKMIYTLLLLAPVLAATLVNANIATAQPASPPCVATEDAAAHVRGPQLMRRVFLDYFAAYN